MKETYSRDFSPLQYRLAEAWTAKNAAPGHKRFVKSQGRKQLRRYSKNILRREVESIGKD